MQFFGDAGRTNLEDYGIAFDFNKLSSYRKRNSFQPCTYAKGKPLLIRRMGSISVIRLRDSFAPALNIISQVSQ
jgi:hypothetical protein